jgi:hypothetical protein
MKDNLIAMAIRFFDQLREGGNTMGEGLFPAPSSLIETVNRLMFERMSGCKFRQVAWQALASALRM